MRRPARRVHANDNTAFNPTIWAKYSLAILESNMVAGNLVYRDFENALANFGDTVNTRKPAAFTAVRKTDSDNVSIQDAISMNIPVQLNMHPHVSFLIKDGEETLAMQSLVDFYLEPAMKAMAEHIDSCILGQYARFMLRAGTAGGLGTLSTTNYQAALAELGKRLDDTKCPVGGRNLIVPSDVKRLILTNQTLVGANQRGDEGTALRTASMGTIYGFDHFMCQNMASFAGAVDQTTGAAINFAAGYKKGRVAALTVDGITGAVTTGQFITLNNRPYQIGAHTESLGNTVTITLTTALLDDAADNAVITLFGGTGLINGAGFVAGWTKAINVDTFTNFPQVGQFLTVGTDVTNIYTVVAADSGAGTITLDRPLVATLGDNTLVNIGPPGSYSLGFVETAIALVIRPLKLPRTGAGAIAGVANHNGFSMRVVITYDGNKQGHLVTIDCLMGLAVLDTSYAAVLLS